MCPPRRRDVLRAAPLAFAAGAGCTTDGLGSTTGTASQSPDRTVAHGDDGTPTGTDTDEGTTLRTETDDPRGSVTREMGESHAAGDGFTVTVERPTVRHGIVEFGTVHPDPLRIEGSQFVVADVAVEGSNTPEVTDLDVAVETDAADRSDRRYVHAERNDEGRQRFGFPVPVDPAPSEAAVVRRPDRGPVVRWPLPDALVTALGRVPDFGVTSFEMPDTAVHESTIETTVGVTNDGERDGRFLAEVGNTSLSDQPEVTADVPVGGTVTVTAEVDAYFVAGDKFEVVLRWAEGIRRRTVRRRG
jgi:hypothetical protein